MNPTIGSMKTIEQNLRLRSDVKEVRDDDVAVKPSEKAHSPRLGQLFRSESFTEGESLQFTGIPNFAPELFRRARLKDPLKLKALQKGLLQLSEEGATQFFRPLVGNDLLLGAVGILQFDVVAYRLKNEYNVDSAFENVNIQTARWVQCEDEKMLADFTRQLHNNLAMDAADQLVYLAPTRVNLQLTEERWPDIHFAHTRESRRY